MTAPEPVDHRNPPAAAPHSEEILSLVALCALLGWRNLDTPAVYRSRGLGPPYRKFGRRVVYLRSDVEAWLRSLPRFSSTSEATVKGEAA